MTAVPTLSFTSHALQRARQRFRLERPCDALVWARNELAAATGCVRQPAGRLRFTTPTARVIVRPHPEGWEIITVWKLKPLERAERARAAQAKAEGVDVKSRDFMKGDRVYREVQIGNGKCRRDYGVVEQVGGRRARVRFEAKALGKAMLGFGELQHVTLMDPAAGQTSGSEIMPSIVMNVDVETAGVAPAVQLARMVQSVAASADPPAEVPAPVPEGPAVAPAPAPVEPWRARVQALLARPDADPVEAWLGLGVELIERQKGIVAEWSAKVAQLEADLRHATAYKQAAQETLERLTRATDPTKRPAQR